jgi:DNA modification methylase
LPDLQTNVLYYGDNLDILRRYIPDASVDLVYLDPPFNSNRDYNVIFRDESGNATDAQLLAFEDTWHWGPSAEATYAYLTNTARHEGRVPDKVSTIIAALRAGIGENQMMAYLVEMAVRLVELHRVLKPTGSLYLHCDPTASHYLKLVLDAIFDARNFRNEVIWKRTGAHNSAKRFGALHDVLLYYAKSRDTTFNRAFQAYSSEYTDSHFTDEDERGRYQAVTLTGPGVLTGEGDSGKPWRGYDPSAHGRHWQPGSYVYAKYSELTGEDLAQYPLLERLDKLSEAGLLHRQGRTGSPRYKYYLADAPGVPFQDIWDDIPPINSQSKEKLGWDTQKPIPLLERVISASSGAGDVVLDPFCGCGTALIAAEKLGRKWIGIDITYLSIAVMKARLKDSFGIEVPVIGQPTEVEGARQLAVGDDGRYQFQWWALNLTDARPLGGTEKKGADRGIDGRITFTVGAKGEMGQALVSVKSGGVNSSMIRDLKGTIEREGAEIGLFITLEEPSKPMLLEASTAGVYTSPISGKDYPRIQILTIRQLLEEHAKPMLPLLLMPTYQQAERIPAKQAAEQKELFG